MPIATAVRKRARPRSPSRPRKTGTSSPRWRAGCRCWRAFGSGDSQLGNQELAERCGLPKSTVSRLTMTLTRLGYLIQTPDTGRYRLGMATLSLGSAMLSRLDLRQVARPLMQELAAFSGASVSLGARDRFSMIYIEHCRGPAALTLSMDVGARIPLATSAIGRAYLAVIDETPARARSWPRCRSTTGRHGPRCAPASSAR